MLHQDRRAANGESRTPPIASAHAPGALLTEIAPASPADAPAAFGFALGWALAHANGLILWAAPEHLEAEHGAPYAEGLAQFGADLTRIMCVRAANQTDALWTAEQGLSIPGALALCMVAPSPKGLSLTATRRLLLLAEKHQSRCVLVRLDPLTASAAWLRLSVRGAPSQGAARELGPPAFDVRLTRNRMGPSGHSWRLAWNAHDNSFVPAHALDGDLVQPAPHGPAQPRRVRAI